MRHERDLILNPEPARELSSREVAKLLGGTLGSLAGLARPETIEAAIKFYNAPQYAEGHRAMWVGLWDQSVKAGFVIPKTED